MSNEGCVLYIGAAVKELLVAGGVDTATIFAGIVPEGAGSLKKGFVTYRHEATDYVYGKPLGAVSAVATVGVCAWNVGIDEAADLAAKCVTAIQEYRGTVGGVDVEEVRLKNVSDVVDTAGGEVLYGKELMWEFVF